jgi:hypothetical protein
MNEQHEYLQRQKADRDNTVTAIPVFHESFSPTQSSYYSVSIRHKKKEI